MAKNIAVVISLFTFYLISCRPDGILINVSYAALHGIEMGDRVLFQQNRTGLVNTVVLNQDGSYTVQLLIEKGFGNAVTEFSQFYVVDDPGREGRKSIEIQIVREGGAPLVSGSTVVGMSPKKDFGSILQQEIDASIGFLIKQIDKFGRNVETLPQSQEYKNLKRSLSELMEEIKRQESQTRDKVKRDVLPKIQRELDRLREQLKRMGREDELAPLERQVDKIHNVY